jgi:hypothetical protein
MELEIVTERIETEGEELESETDEPVAQQERQTTLVDPALPSSVGLCLIACSILMPIRALEQRIIKMNPSIRHPRCMAGLPHTSGG